MLLLGFVAVAFAIFVASVAVPCARLHAFRLYLLIIGGATALGVLLLSFAALSVGGATPSTIGLYLLLILPLGLLYAITPGFLVRQGEPSVSIVKRTIITSAVGIPLWYVLCMLVICRKGDC